MEFKWMRMPLSNAERSVRVVQMWEVRWMARHGEYSGDVRPVVEVFISKSLADEFANSLRQAFRLTRQTSGNRVTVAQS